MAILTLTCNCMDKSEDILENVRLEETILLSINENLKLHKSKTGVDLDMIRFEDKIVFTVIHEVPYCVAVTICLLEVWITQRVADFEQYKEKYSIDKYRILLNYDTRDHVPTLRNSPDSINYRYILLKLNLQMLIQWVCTQRQV